MGWPTASSSTVSCFLADKLYNAELLIAYYDVNASSKVGFLPFLVDVGAF